MVNATNDTKKAAGEDEHYTIDAASGEMLFKDAFAFHSHALERVAAWERSHAASVKKPCMYIYKSLVFDITEFVNAHPGGVAICEEFNGKDITTTFHNEYNHHGHTDKALNMLLQYRVGRIVDPTKTNLKMNYEEGQQDREYEIYKLNELTAYPAMTETEIKYKDFTIRRDRGLIWQSMQLTRDQYFHLIETPIYVPYCKLFDFGLLEPFSRTRYWVVAVLWLPLALFFILRGVFADRGGSGLDRLVYYPNRNLLFTSYPYPGSVPQGASAAEAAAAADAQLARAAELSHFSLVWVALAFALGVLFWTLLEYCIHRFLFHFEKLVRPRVMENPLLIMLHMVLHGIHHIIPMDPDRLVFPPVLFVVVCGAIYWGIYSLISGNFVDIVFGSAVAGYVCYDEIHYYIHHADPQDFYFKDLKKYHHAHHYVNDMTGFGISNKLWDLVFGTGCRKA